MQKPVAKEFTYATGFCNGFGREKRGLRRVAKGIPFATMRVKSRVVHAHQGHFMLKSMSLENGLLTILVPMLPRPNFEMLEELQSQNFDFTEMINFLSSAFKALSSE